MIALQNISKTFTTKSGAVQAVKDVSLAINTGEIFGIIGYSGAGKSTIVRCINLLERPEKGAVLIDGIDLTKLKSADLRQRRLKIGMIFQNFNLFASRTAYDNVAFSLRHRGLSQQEINSKVLSLLELVGLTDKAKTYPSQLSGGQKQRVAIARSLANDPDILLCDEATSALDPQTTQSILELIKQLNRKLNLTVVIITHEMNVVKDICNRVAVMEEGKIVEEGSVVEIFANPQQKITKDFIDTVSNFSKIEELVSEKASVVELFGEQKLIRLDFTGESTKDAIISEISRKFNTPASIIFANVEIIQGVILGTIVIILDGNASDQQAALAYLREKNIKVGGIDYD